MDPASLYILNQKEPFKSMLLQVQILVKHVIEDAELLYKYRIPFYYVDGKPFCYLNVSKGYLDIGFWHAAHLTKHTELMVAEGRKVMKSLRYYTPEDINEEILIEVLQEAYELRNKKFYK